MVSRHLRTITGGVAYATFNLLNAARRGGSKQRWLNRAMLRNPMSFLLQQLSCKASRSGGLGAFLPTATGIAQSRGRCCTTPHERLALLAQEYGREARALVLDCARVAAQIIRGPAHWELEPDETISGARHLDEPGSAPYAIHSIRTTQKPTQSEPPLQRTSCISITWQVGLLENRIWQSHA